MIDARAIRREVQDQVLDTARKSQQTVTATIRTLSQAAQAVRPQLPHLTVPEIRVRITAPPLPSPRALVMGAYDVAGHVLAVQRRLAEQAVQAAMPVLTRQAPTTRTHAAQAPAAAAGDRALAAAKADAKPSAKTSAGAQNTAAKSSAANSGAAKSSAAKSRAKASAPAQGTAAKASPSAKRTAAKSGRPARANAAAPEREAGQR